MVLPTPSLVHRPSQPSNKALLRHKGDTISYDVVGSSCQLVSQCIVRHHPVRLLYLVIIISPRVIIVPPGQLSGFRESPSKVLVAVLLVPGALLLVVADPFGRNLPAIGHVVAHLGKAADRSGLQHDRKAQNLPDAGFGQKTVIGFSKVYLLLYDGLDRLDLAGKEIDALFADLAGQGQILVPFQEGGNVVRR